MKSYNNYNNNRMEIYTRQAVFWLNSKILQHAV